MTDLPPGVDPRTGPGFADDAATDGPSPLRPAVAGAGAGGSAWLIGGGSAALGLLAFLYLSSHRTPPAKELPPPSQAADAAAVAAPPPPPEVDAAEATARGSLPARPAPALALVTPPPPAPILPLSQPNVATPTPPASPARAPVLVVDLAQAPTVAASTAPGGAAAAAGSPAQRAASLNANEQFEQRLETTQEPDRARATWLRDPSTTAPQGTIIPAVLETALNSDLPGFARAVVSRDVRSFDGSTVLIPRGSRVIGEYRSNAAQGQSRVFVIWTRVLRPDGGSIQISSGGGDELGRAGLAGKVDRHFLERFSGAVLLTVLNAAAYAAAAGNSSTAVVVNSSSGSGASGLTSGLTPTDIAPTIKVAQGTPIRIFVQRDLDFTPVGGTP